MAAANHFTEVGSGFSILVSGATWTAFAAALVVRRLKHLDLNLWLVTRLLGIGPMAVCLLVLGPVALIAGSAVFDPVFISIAASYCAPLLWVVISAMAAWIIMIVFRDTPQPPALFWGLTTLFAGLHIVGLLSQHHTIP